MDTSSRHQWARCLLFEGVELPPSAFAIDHLAREPEISEEASVWLWRFTICVGVTNRDNSQNVIRYASEALDIATRFRERLLLTVPARFDGPFDAQVIDEWIMSLKTIIELARNTVECSWTASAPDQPTAICT